MNRAPLPAPPHAGGCLCGAVRYAYTVRPLALNACHCGQCKRLTGSDYIKALVGERAYFSHSGETISFRKRAESGREIDIVRCAQCGTRVWHDPLSAPQLVFIAAGTLDDSSWTTPASHIWTAFADPAVGYAPDAIRIDGQPDDRQALFDAFDRVFPR